MQIHAITIENALHQGVGPLGLISELPHWMHHLFGLLFLMQKNKGIDRSNVSDLSYRTLGFYGGAPGILQTCDSYFCVV